MRRKPIDTTIDLDRLFKDLAGSARGKQLREEVKGSPHLTREKAEAYVRGECEHNAVREVRVHLLGCSECAEVLAQIKGHPFEEVLLCYAMNAIPADSLGAQLRQAVDSHLRVCERCREQTLLEIHRWSEVQQAIVKMSWVQALFMALGEADKAKRRPIRIRGKVRVRGGQPSGEEREVVQALVVDDKGKSPLDSEGKPKTVPFTVLGASVEPKTGLHVLVSSESVPVPLPGRSRPTVQISLLHESQCLTFAPVELLPGEDKAHPKEWIASLHVDLGLDIDISQIPAKSLRLTIEIP